MTRERFNTLEPAIQKRVRMEMQIAQRVVRDAIKAGWRLTVDYGEDELPVENSASVERVVAALLECDEEYLILRRFDGNGAQTAKGWVRFVYGNSGWDVICDYSVNIEGVLAGAEALAERLEERATR